MELGKMRKVVGVNKRRDFKILCLWAKGMHPADIARLPEIDVGQKRIEQIVYRNRALVSYERKWEKVKQIRRIKKRIHDKEQEPSKKDVFDWEVFLDDIIRKRGEQQQAAAETKVIIIRETSDADKNQERSIPRPISVQRI